MERIARYRWVARFVRLPVLYQFAAFVYDGLCAPILTVRTSLDAVDQLSKYPDDTSVRSPISTPVTPRGAPH